MIYKISDAKVSIANTRFTTVNFPYELMLEKYTKIEQLEDDGSILISSFSFTPIADLKILGIGKQTDIACIVGMIGPLEKFRFIRKDPARPVEEFRLKRTVTIFDDSEHSIDLTLYDKFATEFKSDDEEEEK